MIERRNLNRRINYGYLARLEERLQEFGHTLKDWPDYVIEQTWNVHKDYIKEEYGLDYCMRCHLPIRSNELDTEYNDTCLEHGQSAREALAARRDKKHSAYIDKASKRIDPTKIDSRVLSILHHAQVNETNRLNAPLPPATPRKPFDIAKFLETATTRKKD
jgi:hypothetical protein